MRWKHYIALVLLVLPLAALAQVESEDRINLTGTTDADRQVENLALPQQLNAAVNAASVQQHYVNFATTSGTANAIALTLPTTPAAYTAGMEVSFIATDTNTAAVTLDVNGLGPVPLVKEALEELDAANITAGQAVTAVFDGSNFQVTTPLSRNCPSGFVSVNERFCIEQDESIADSFWNALVRCGDQNARLCTWGEWQHACLDAIALGLLNTTNNWEWVDDAGNFSTGINDALVRVAGNTSCTEATNGNQVSTNYSYRCCYSK